jgi:hypothetical protein
MMSIVALTSSLVLDVNKNMTFQEVQESLKAIGKVFEDALASPDKPLKFDLFAVQAQTVFLEEQTRRLTRVGHFAVLPSHLYL